MHNQTMRTLALLALVPLLSSKASIAAKRQSGGTVALVNVRVVSMNPDDRVSRQLNLGTEARGTSRAIGARLEKRLAPLAGGALKRKVLCVST